MRQRQVMWFLFFAMLSSQMVTAEPQCVRLSQVPATYRTVPVFQPEILKEKLEIIPPVFQKVTENILVVEAHCPDDQLVSDEVTIEIRQAFTDILLIPAVYETIYVKKQIQPPTEGWLLIKENRIAYKQQPERFEVVGIRQIKLAEQAREIAVPATHRTIKVSRVRQPARQCADDGRIPARFLTIEKKLLVKKAKVKRTSVSTQTEIITKQVIEKRSSIKSTPVACGTPGALPKAAAQLPDKPTSNRQRQYYFLSKQESTGQKAAWISLDRTMALMMATPGRRDLPRLPWPPPRGSWLFPVPQLPFENAVVMSDVESVLAPALREAGYTNQRYYRVDNTDGSRNGFAIVTQLEKWVGKGVPDKKKRFVRVGQEKFSLKDYIRNLFFAPEGTYRLILMLVTDKTWSWDDDPEKQMTEEMADEWLFGGASNLPEQFQKVKFTPRHRVEVVIYEFRREGETVILELPGGLTTAENHFKHSGLQSKLGLEKP
ncbi:MAG TPA: hypothetical protein EYH06_12535 [Chromatiales bacterium]|nr:hypothetical protein [Thiotrichales bacterium]HIP69391.1 hypothetical protein [Chromatiales bacterium]